MKTKYNGWLSGVGFFMSVVTCLIILPRWKALDEWQRWVGWGWIVATLIVVFIDSVLAYRLWRKDQER